MSGGQCDWKVLSKDQLLFWSLWFGVPAVILGLSCVTSNALALAVDHAPRVLGLIVAAAFGWWLGARLAKRVGRPATAYRVTAALALALLAWVFIPTLHRRSPATVVSGTRCIASALRAVDASDLEGFNRTSSARGTIAAWQFPTLRAWSNHQLDAAERSWAEKVADELGARLRALTPSDLDGYTALAADPRLSTTVGRGLEGASTAFSPGARGRPRTSPPRLARSSPGTLRASSAADEIGRSSGRRIPPMPLLSARPRRRGSSALLRLARSSPGTSRVSSAADEIGRSSGRRFPPMPPLSARPRRRGSSARSRRSRLRSSRCCRPTPSGRPRGPRGR